MELDNCRGELVAMKMSAIKTDSVDRTGHLLQIGKYIDISKQDPLQAVNSAASAHLMKHSPKVIPVPTFHSLTILLPVVMDTFAGRESNPVAFQCPF